MVLAGRKRFARTIGLVVLTLQLVGPAFQAAHEALHHGHAGDVVDAASTTTPALASASAAHVNHHHGSSTSADCAVCHAATRVKHIVPTGEYQLYTSELAAAVHDSNYRDALSRTHVAGLGSRAPPQFS